MDKLWTDTTKVLDFRNGPHCFLQIHQIYVTSIRIGLPIFFFKKSVQNSMDLVWTRRF